MRSVRNMAQQMPAKDVPMQASAMFLLSPNVHISRLFEFSVQSYEEMLCSATFLIFIK